ncbi:hypothetical protein ACFUMH_05690 [Cellulomonas sp. NPDC057328]|uniref:hypothetical protein n=1 Tax=Cellulomonas sp. NPDC057328 TaxID=3346101 RepID=UPI00363EB931
MSDSTPGASSAVPSPAALAHAATTHAATTHAATTQGVPAHGTRTAPVPGPPVAPTPADVRPAPASDDATATGDAAVDEALGRLRDVAELDLRAQLTAFEAVHGALQDRLADAEG